MANHDFDKLWLSQSLNQTAINRVKEGIGKLGSALPCRVTNVSGSFVTVAFEVNSAPFVLPEITIPKAEGQWIRSPTQVGDFGLTVPADVHLSGISEGGATVGLQQPGNLSGLVWVPVAATAFSTVNTNAAYVSGPEGALITTEDGSASIIVGPTGITMTFGSKSVTLDASGFTIDGILFDTHVHGGVSTGGSNTTGPA